ncbi:hypothetical protein M3Y94_00742100 [Aphelenchoides besseyi]|nr:hypothetical protein M3Y94_00742100 [Aphelenchoides besseyi]KAI6231992.1 hypothetical protein M3Y95_00439900 [Aphelenchoides besseyi]
MCIASKADVYLFDEPSSYLDVRQRLEAAKAIRECSTSSNYVMVVEHDLTILDYLSDFVCIFYGVSGAYSTDTPQSLLDGMNRFLEILNISFRCDDESHRPRINKLDSVKDTGAKEVWKLLFGYCLSQTIRKIMRVLSLHFVLSVTD